MICGGPKSDKSKDSKLDESNAESYKGLLGQSDDEDWHKV